MSADAHDGVVGLRPSSCRIDDRPDDLVLDEVEPGRVEHERNVALAEDLLQGIKGQARQLGLDQVRAVLHHNFKLAMALLGLPGRHQMQHVDALCLFAGLLARLAAQLDAARREEGPAGGGVVHLDEARVKVNL